MKSSFGDLLSPYIDARISGHAWGIPANLMVLWPHFLYKICGGFRETSDCWKYRFWKTFASLGSEGWGRMYSEATEFSRIMSYLVMQISHIAQRRRCYQMRTKP